MNYVEVNVRDVIHPEAIFDDANGDGVVTIEEARADVVARFSLSPTSLVRNAGASLQTVENLVSQAVPDIVDAANDLIDYFNTRPNSIPQHRQAANMWTRMVSGLLTSGRKGFGDLSGLRDLSGASVPTDSALDMGAVQ